MKTKRTLYTLFFLLLFSNISSAQVGPGGAYNIDWILQEGNVNFEAIGAIPDNIGNIYVFRRSLI